MYYHLLLQVVSCNQVVNKLAPMRSPWVIHSVAIVAALLIIIVSNHGLLLLHGCV